MKKYMIVMGIIVFSLIGISVSQNKFDMTIKEDMVDAEGGKIAVEYAIPKEMKEKPGLVLFIHGDGPANKNGDEGYYPAWEVLAKENMIAISWDKAGVGKSTGNWLKQDMVDRKEEAETVLTWAFDHFDVDPNRVGVWGASQGGWVITKLLNENDDVKFAIGVAPAVNWMRQGRFNTIHDMKFEGYSQQEIDERLSIQSEVNQYLAQNDYQGYIESKLEEDVLEKDRWDFIHKNMGLDNTSELAKISKPYYLILGDHDINVDSKETKERYTEHIDGKYLRIYEIEDATHRMLKSRHQKDNLLMVVESLFNPREIFAPEYLKALKEIVSK